MRRKHREKRSKRVPPASTRCATVSRITSSAWESSLLISSVIRAIPSWTLAVNCGSPRLTAGIMLVAVGMRTTLTRVQDKVWRVQCRVSVTV